MFVPKTTSRQKRGKKMQECKTGGSTLYNSQLRVTSLAIATWLQGAPVARIQLAIASTVASYDSSFGKKSHFHPKL
jgi:hypothetical protein